MIIRKLKSEDVSDNYVRWMNDVEITEFLESNACDHTLESIRAYVAKIPVQDHLLGIFYESKHIGNVKISNINARHKFAQIGLIIGEKNLHGQGLGTKVIKLATEYGLKDLHLNKLVAGIYENNKASYKAFIKAGYREVGRHLSHRFYRGNYIDEIVVEKGLCS